MCSEPVRVRGGAWQQPVLRVLGPAAGLLARKDASYRYTWDRSLFLTCRRQELRSVMAELDFSQQVGDAFGLPEAP